MRTFQFGYTNTTGGFYRHTVKADSLDAAISKLKQEKQFIDEIVSVVEL